MAEPLRRRSGRAVALALAGAGLALVMMTGLWLWVHAGSVDESDQTSDLHGTKVTLGAGVLPPPETLAQMRVDNDLGTRFDVPSVGLDVALGSLSMAADDITPPGITSAYLVRNLGVPPARADKGTVYVVMHSLHGGGVGPGNYLMDVDAGTSAVKKGALIEVAGVRYRTTASMVVPQTALPQQQAVWRDQPHRLVVITCLQNADGTPGTRNLVIEASQVEVGGHPKRV